MKRKDQLSGVFWLLIALLVIQQSLRLKLGTFRNPGPGLVPLIWGIALTLLSVCNVSQATLRRNSQQDRVHLKVNWPILARLGFLTAILIGFTFIFPHLGFFFSAFWVLLFLFRDEHKKKWAVPLLQAAISIIASYFLFHIFMQIEFPLGPWGLR